MKSRRQQLIDRNMTYRGIPIFIPPDYDENGREILDDVPYRVEEPRKELPEWIKDA